MTLREVIRSDLYRHEKLCGFMGFLRGWFIPGFRYTLLFRICAKYGRGTPTGFVFRFLKRRYRFKYGFEIDSGARIGEGFYLTSHCGPIIIGPVTIGKYCNISHTVTIGRSYRGGELGRPEIGDFVWIGPGSVIVGKINIGSNVLIAPNTFINFNVPSNSLVIGSPGKIISRDNPTRYYINDIPGEH